MYDSRNFSDFSRDRDNVRRERRRESSSPFKVDLCCNVNIEVHVAMRLGELIIASGTPDKQLMALGHKLAGSMNHLVEQLDHRQWDALYSHMEEQTQDDDDSYEAEDNSYSLNAQKSFSDLGYKNNEVPHRDMKDFVSSVVSRKE